MLSTKKKKKKVTFPKYLIPHEINQSDIFRCQPWPRLSLEHGALVTRPRGVRWARRRLAAASPHTRRHVHCSVRRRAWHSHAGVVQGWRKLTNSLVTDRVLPTGSHPRPRGRCRQKEADSKPGGAGGQTEQEAGSGSQEEETDGGEEEEEGRSGTREKVCVSFARLCS